MLSVVIVMGDLSEQENIRAKNLIEIISSQTIINSLKLIDNLFRNVGNYSSNSPSGGVYRNISYLKERREKA